MRDLELTVIVLDRASPHPMPGRTLAGGERDKSFMTNFWVADETGSVAMSIVGPIGQYISKGDILKLTGALANLHNKHLKLQVRDTTKIERLGSITLAFRTKPNVSLDEWITDETKGGELVPHPRADLSTFDPPWLPGKPRSAPPFEKGAGPTAPAAPSTGTAPHIPHMANPSTQPPSILPYPAAITGRSSTAAPSRDPRLSAASNRDSPSLSGTSDHPPLRLSRTGSRDPRLRSDVVRQKTDEYDGKPFPSIPSIEHQDTFLRTGAISGGGEGIKDRDPYSFSNYHQQSPTDSSIRQGDERRHMAVDFGTSYSRSGQDRLFGQEQSGNPSSGHGPVTTTDIHPQPRADVSGGTISPSYRDEETTSALQSHHSISYTVPELPRMLVPEIPRPSFPLLRPPPPMPPRMRSPSVAQPSTSQRSHSTRRWEDDEIEVEIPIMRGGWMGRGRA
ncbi:hypothetical protein M427DRAFT_141054 [Gonapodya prolifera JEL478]|uniref:Uncharacterized protein n=1 Tax=Gonapodya prolifera (strain JEL478) TaxID=1344416 RepID=A0A138ZXX2_GONPJ|nr:hypothetical protein M427DRAFT_141054 [Gonapodya prolifera JEL478]|eukprot:KXS09336.1 hypothetical protein M427DRAFT_141054 [Gonapodya prolifera JEL478]